MLEATKGFNTKVPSSKRRKLGNTVNDQLLNSILRQRHSVFLFENATAAEMVLAYEEALVSIEASLLKIARSEDAMTDFRRIRQSRLQSLKFRLSEAIQIGGMAAEGAITGNIEGLVNKEWAFQSKLLRKTVPSVVPLDLVGPDINMVSTILQQPMGGAQYSARFLKNHGESVVKMQQSLATSVSLGEGFEAAARRMRGSVEGLLQRRAVLIARSEIQRAANATAMAFYNSQDVVIKGITIMETLDVRTCMICIQQDGKFFPLGTSPGLLPPYHAACRGFVAPVTKSWEELGIDKKEMPAGTRASMNGEVPDAVIYEGWFKDQDSAFQRRVLGPSRFELFQTGEVGITEFARSGRILTLAELPVAP
jgi:SPP1 gp7 family putative phage head morphogenesis protein